MLIITNILTVIAKLSKFLAIVARITLSEMIYRSLFCLKLVPCFSYNLSFINGNFKWYKTYKILTKFIKGIIYKLERCLLI